jgi:hypothetical protein
MTLAPSSMESDHPQSVALTSSSPFVGVIPLAYYPTHLRPVIFTFIPSLSLFPPMDPQVVTCSDFGVTTSYPYLSESSVLNVITIILGREMPENLAGVSTLATVGRSRGSESLIVVTCS